MAVTWEKEPMEPNLQESKIQPSLLCRAYSAEPTPPKQRLRRPEAAAAKAGSSGCKGRKQRLRRLEARAAMAGEISVHADRAIGGHRHHRGSCGNVAAGTVQREESRANGD